jgi:hypothetical protein
MGCSRLKRNNWVAIFFRGDSTKERKGRQGKGTGRSHPSLNNRTVTGTKELFQSSDVQGTKELFQSSDAQDSKPDSNDLRNVRELLNNRNSCSRCEKPKKSFTVWV